jgi:hypothetical protein
VNGANESELREELQRLRAERESLLAELPSLRNEVEACVLTREALIEELGILRRESARLMGELEKAAARLSTLPADLENAGAAHQATQAKPAAGQSTLPAVEKEDPGLALLFENSKREISPDWDSYQLESEFHTDEPLDAKRVAELVKELPGVAGCLIVKDHGPVLAGQLAEHLYDLLRVPDRNYHLLYERLPNCVQKQDRPEAHGATFQLGDGCLMVTQASRTFVVTHHVQSRVYPGIPEKLATVAAELARMYP